MNNNLSYVAIFGGLKTTENVTLSYSVIKALENHTPHKYESDGRDSLVEDVFKILYPLNVDTVVRINDIKFKDIMTCIKDSTETIEEIKNINPGVPVIARTDDVGKAFWEHFGLKQVYIGCTNEITMISEEYANIIEGRF